MIKKLLIFLVVMFGVGMVLGFKGWTPWKGSSDSAVTQSSIIVVRQRILSGEPDDRKLLMRYQPSRGTTVMELLKSTTSVMVKGQGKDAKIIEIDGHAIDEEQGERWIFSVNGKKVSKRAEEYVLQEKDLVEWKKEKN